MNYTQNPNRAHQYPIITLIVEHVDENSCTYRNFHDKSGRTYTFKAASAHDHWVLTKLEAGGSYAIMQSVGSRNRTCWTAAMPYTKSMPKPTSDSIMAFISRKQSTTTCGLATAFNINETVQF